MKCPLTNFEIPCTDNCRDCAKDLYEELQDKAGNAEKVTEDAIRNELGDNAFIMLKSYGFIEHCHLDELGRHWYAI